ncbi:hypothetical protein [Microcoleus vaginatus]|uniref:hypothetical protein n=1 Tax=Microcoleus vaginatus TaxID=119532 RepID=UPI001682FEBC|nr:hypothetical protein [Microcoleus sp. FACHB-84]MBD2007255.1 hypothetical protein [Microcoleus sp. FACHB-45]
MLIGQASFCPDPNWMQMIVVGSLIALLIAATGGMIVLIYLIISAMLAAATFLAWITGGFLSLIQLPLYWHTLGIFGVIWLFVVGGITRMLGCG